MVYVNDFKRRMIVAAASTPPRSRFLLARRIGSISALIGAVGSVWIVCAISTGGSGTDGSRSEAHPNATAYATVVASAANTSACDASAPNTSGTDARGTSPANTSTTSAANPSAATCEDVS
jgi:hypothetical protein